MAPRSRTCWMAVAALGALIVLALVAVACGSDSSSTTSAATDPVRPSVTVSLPTPSTTVNQATAVQLAMSDLTRLAPAASQTDLLSAAASMQAFGVDLYRVLKNTTGDKNLVFSPSSIVTALAMTYAGAGGSTAQEMAATLHFHLEGDALHQAFNSLDAALESVNFEQKDPEGHQVGVLIKTANSLWGQRDLAFEKLFLDTLAADYGAGIRLVDCKTAAEKARQAINAWVADQTDDKIPELVPQGALDSLTRLVLVNAIYLHATWMAQFDPGSTKDGAFTTAAGATVTARMMRQTFSFPYGKGDGWQAVQLPYLGGKVALMVIVPDKGRFAEVESRLALDSPGATGVSAPSTGGLIDQAVASLGEGTEVDLTLPKFQFRTQAGLKDALVALGMKSAFGPEADFSGMTKQESLSISDVIHEAYIAVDEEGTEAAAATAVIMRATGMPAQPLQLIVDRPFIFALRDLETGALLFLGRVTDPTA